MKNNDKIIEALKVTLVKEWELAESLKISPAYLSKRLRGYPLSKETTKIWLKHIQALAEGGHTK